MNYDSCAACNVWHSNYENGLQKKTLDNYKGTVYPTHSMLECHQQTSQTSTKHATVSISHHDGSCHDGVLTDTARVCSVVQSQVASDIKSETIVHSLSLLQHSLAPVQ